MNLSNFTEIAKSTNLLVNYLMQIGVFLNIIKCSGCGVDCGLNRDTLMYRCQKSTTHIDNKKRKTLKRCNFKKSARKGTFFESKRLDITKIALFAAHFVLLPHPRTEVLLNELNISRTVLLDWSSYCREVCLAWRKSQQKRLGGPSSIVEIGEAKFDQRKFNKGQVLKGQWVFGGIDRNTKDIFIVSVEKRDTCTLLNLIKEWILPGTTIISHCWKAYNCLSDEGFQHLTANHSYNFVDPETGTHTQNIQRLWRELHANIPKIGQKKAHFQGYIAEFLFKRHIPYQNRIENFLKSSIDIYK